MPSYLTLKQLIDSGPRKMMIINVHKGGKVLALGTKQY
jgi:hypothetical protein